jgi:hypothetical protein
MYAYLASPMRSGKNRKRVLIEASTCPVTSVVERNAEDGLVAADESWSLRMVCGPFASAEAAAAFVDEWSQSARALDEKLEQGVDLCRRHGHECYVNEPPVATADEERARLVTATAAHAGRDVAAAAAAMYDRIRQRCIAYASPPAYLVRYVASHHHH